MNTLEPKIYVACLAAYNNGYLHGAWIDANQSSDELYEAVKKMLAASPIPNAEEWAIHDYEDFGSVYIEESTSLKAISEIAAFIDEHGQLGAELISHASGDLEYAYRLMEEGYHGEYNSTEDFAASMTEETTSIPENLVYYIDYEKMARDWFMSDFFSIKINFKVHIFCHL
jgi:antirestriction protein